MAEVRYDDEDRVEALEETYEVELAGLNENESRQVHDALTEAEFSGELGQVDMDDTILSAQVAEDNREDAELAQREQAQAADRGDFETAREKAEEVGDNLADASAQGAKLSEAVQENDHDVLVLEEAEFQAESAEAFADGAVVFADAETDSDLAAHEAIHDAQDAADTADDYLEQGDQGGTYGDQSIHTDGT
ncbi:MAG: hypothetical protein R3E84_02130 [Pseudomonadales bacterium]|nr:hypothetical protein [Pseudomonadales bacterium]